MKLSIGRLIAASLAVACAWLCTRPLLANDWYQWRGPEQNGVSRETHLPESWSPDGDNVVWNAPIGGMSSPIVMKGKLYTITRVGEEPADNGTAVIAGPKTQEAVVCLDAKTGQQLWVHTSNMYMTDDPFHRLGWSNVCGDPATGRVYALGAQNELVCLDGDSGKVVWLHQMTEEYGVISTFGGRTPSPAIDEDQVFVAGVAFGWADNAGGQYRVFAFDKTTGEPRWTNGTGGIPVDAPYQTPTITNINGEHVLVTGSGDGGAYCFQARTGKKLWGFKGAKRGYNASPLVHDNKVYVNWDLDNYDSTRLGRIVCLDPSEIKDGSPKEVWRIDGIEAGFPSSTFGDGTLYVADDKAIIYAINPETGKIKYKKGFGTIGKASLVYADGKLYFPEANGRMMILKPGEKKFEVLSHVDLEEKKGREYTIFGSVAIANGHVYLAAANRTFCIGSKDFTEQNVPIPPEGKEEPAPPGEKAAFVQVLPCDVRLHPGESVQFVARGFDEKGRMVALGADNKWEIGQLTLPAPRKRPTALIRPNSAAAARPGPTTAPTTVATTAPSAQPAGPIKAGNLKGELTEKGQFTAAPGPLQGGAVVLNSGPVTGFARVRVFPPLPWKFDFEQNLVGKPPLTWIGAGMKFAVSELPENGKPNKVLKKLTDIPLYARARTYFGTPEMNDYTIEADVQVTETVYEEGGQVVHKIPDAGVINGRYVLELKGADQWLSLHPWPAALPPVEINPGWASHAAVAFPWKAHAWYHVKLMVEQQEGKAICRGKAWPTGTPEPTDWTLSLTDETLNTHGSPGLWGFSNDHEIYYDNVLVTPNHRPAAMVTPSR